MPNNDSYVHSGNIAERVQTVPYDRGYVAVFTENAELVAEPRTVILSSVCSTEDDARRAGETFLRDAITVSRPGETYSWLKDARDPRLHRVWRTDGIIPKLVV